MGFERVRTGSLQLSLTVNPRLDRWFSPGYIENLGLDHGPVLNGSGSNFGSGLNHGKPSR